MAILFALDARANVSNMRLNVGSSVIFLDVWANSDDVSLVVEHFFVV